MELPVLNQKEVLQRLNISWKRLRRLEREGKLRAIRISLGTIRYFESDVLKLEKELESEGGEL